jgi:threonine/homoserine efflux transporter RhtA
MLPLSGRGMRVLPAPGLVIGGIVGLQCGAALTTRLFAAVGPAGVVTLRLFIAAVVLIAAWRPWLRHRGRPGLHRCQPRHWQAGSQH